MKPKLVILFLLISRLVGSQPCNLAFSIGSPNPDDGKDIAIDGLGNTYLTGAFQGTADFDPGTGTANLTSAGLNDGYIVKYNSSGQYQWAFNLGSGNICNGTALAVDNSGNVYAAGFFDGTIDFDPGGGTSNLTAIGGDDAYVAKYNSAGQYQWAFNLGNTGDDAVTSLAVTKTGDLFVSGYFSGTADFDPSAVAVNLTSNGSDDGFLAKYSALGNYQWAFNLGSTAGDDVYTIAVDTLDNVYASGSFVYTVDFDPSAAIANLVWTQPYGEIFIAKYSPTGAYSWAFKVGGVNEASCNSIAVSDSGNVFATGHFRGTADFDGAAGVANLTATGTLEDIFVAKYDSSGQYKWAINVGNTATDKAFSIVINKAEESYVTGLFQSTVDFDPGAAIASLTAQGNDIFIANYNATGNLKGAFKIGGLNADQGQAMVVDKQNNVYATGFFQGIADFNPGLVTNNIYAVGVSDAFLFKVPKALLKPSVVKNVSCKGDSTGSAIAGIWGGTSPFLYNWSSGETTAMAIELANATYTITVTDASGCTSSQLVSITEPFSAFSYSVTVQNVSACTVSDGSANIKLSGGNTPYSYSWSTGQTTSAISGLAQGVYTVTVTDANTCAYTTSVTVYCLTGISDHNPGTDIEIYPNPTSGKFTMNMTSDNVEIYNALGKIVYSKPPAQNISSIDLSAQPCGVYFLRVTTQKGMVCKKVVIQR